jgi:hypothetical protein
MEMLCESKKGVTVNRVYAFRQCKMMMVAVVPQRQADRQIHHPTVSVVAGSSPEECPKAVKLLFY